MEDSGHNGLMIGVYVFVFLIATSLTIYLFSTTVAVADQSYEYGKTTTGDSVIETVVDSQYSIVTGAELLTYYYNYKSPDKYGSATVPTFDFSNINEVGIDINKSYALIYKSDDTGANPVIIVKDITSEVGAPSSGEVITVNNQPSDPTISTFPSTALRINPNTLVEFEANSYVNVSFTTNTIVKYYWKIDYSTEDGRPDFSVVTNGNVGKLTEALYGDALKFVDGINIVSVTSEDAFGNKSNTVIKEISVGFYNPLINSIKEENNKVTDNQYVVTVSPTGADLTFVADAISKNTGGYIQRYDWYVNDVLTKSTASERFTNSFAPRVLCN